MKLLTPYDVAEITGLPYSKALLLVKGANHVQMGNRYYISEAALAAILTPATPILITQEN